MKTKLPLHVRLLMASVLIVSVCAGKYDVPTGESDPDGRPSSQVGDRTGSSPRESWEYDTMPAPAPSETPFERVNELSFEYNSHSLDRQGIAICRQTAAQVRLMPQARVMIVGFSHERELDRGLGLRRAEQVRRYMAGLGIDNSRLETASYGIEFSENSDPAYPHRMKQGQSVEIWILEK